MQCQRVFRLALAVLLLFNVLTPGAIACNNMELAKTLVSLCSRARKRSAQMADPEPRGWGNTMRGDHGLRNAGPSNSGRGLDNLETVRRAKHAWPPFLRRQRRSVLIPELLHNCCAHKCSMAYFISACQG